MLLRTSLYQTRRSLLKAYQSFCMELSLSRYEKRFQEELIRERKAWESKYKNEREPFVSVIIATYNRAKVLTERTLPSLLKQTYSNFEVVIVGDKCSDDTEKRVKALDDSRIRFMNLEKRSKYPKDFLKRHAVKGIVPHRMALSLAKGSWFAHMDDDDEFTSDHLEEQLKLATAHDYEFVYAKQKYQMKPGEWQEVGRYGFPTGRYPFNRCCIPHRTVLFRSYLKLFHFCKDTEQAWKYGVTGDIFTWEHMGRAGVRAGYLDKVIARKYNEKSAFDG